MQQVRALRPMGFLEIIDQTFRVYRANFVLFFSVAAVLYIPVSVLSAVPGLGVVIMLLSLPATPLAYGALIKAVSDRYLGQPIDMGGAYRYVWQRFWPLVLTLVLAQILLFTVAMIGMLGAILFPVFARARAMAALAAGGPPSSMDTASLMIFVVAVAILTTVALVAALIWWVFITPVVVVEDIRYLGAIRRAWFLIRRWTWWRILWIGFVLFLIVGVLMLVLLAPAMSLPSRAPAAPPSSSVSAVESLVFGLAEAVIMPLFFVALILVYYDSRIRKEGFDLQMLAREVGVALPQPASAPPAPPARPAAPAAPAPRAQVAASAPPAAPPAPQAAQPPRPAWKASDPRLASHMPLSALRRIFIFTDSDGRATPGSTAVLETVQDTAEAPISEFGNRVPVNVIARSNAGTEVMQTRAVPESVWTSMSRIDAELTARARAGQARTCVRGFDDANTHEQGVIIMVYDV